MNATQLDAVTATLASLIGQFSDAELAELTMAPYVEARSSLLTPVAA